MKNILFRSVMMTLIMGFLTCALYPLMVTVTANSFFKKEAEGSLVSYQDKIVGSALLGQEFKSPLFFHARPSFNNYDAMNSSSAHLALSEKKYLIHLQTQIETLKSENPSLTNEKIPVHLVSYSASGLDPHISPTAAEAQIERIARMREMNFDMLKKLVDSHIEHPTWNILGEARVNVLLLNLALEKRFPMGVK